MPKREFALEQDGPKRLSISWSGMWKNMDVRLDGKLLGQIPNQAALKAGQEFALGDGTRLKVRLVTGFAAELQVTRDGVPLPGSSSNPEERLKQAWMMIFFIAGLNGALGLAAIVFHIEFLLNLGLGYSSLALAALYGGLGFAVKTYRSSIALGIAVGLFGLDGIASMAMSVSAGGSPGPGGIIARVFLIIPMVKGFAAIRELKKQPRPAPAIDIPANVASKGQPWEPPRKS